MKYCPNPDCGGLEKFGIISEFNDTSTECADCGAALLSGAAPDTLAEGKPAPEPDLKLVPVIAVINESDIILIESLLGDAEIPYLARGEQIQDLFGLGRLAGINAITEPVEFLVAEENFADARGVLADFLDKGANTEE
jgi:hypothetical protein